MRAGKPCAADTRPSPLPQVANASEYGGILLDGGITLGVAQRRAMIWSAITDVARYFGGYVPDACQQDLLPEVANLVEAPTVVAGSFSSSFLSIPGYAHSSQCCGGSWQLVCAPLRIG